MMAQYSVPFCAALALHRDPRNPESFSEGALDDADIRALCRRVTVRAAGEGADHGAAASSVTVELKGGRRLSSTEADGTLAPADLADKFTRLTRAALGERGAAALLERLRQLEDEASLDWLGGV
jgi:2-methylcitrate dehydratase PrpD